MFGTKNINNIKEISKNEKDEMYEGIKPLKENNISYLPESFLNNNVKIMDDEGYKTDVRELLGNNRVK